MSIDRQGKNSGMDGAEIEAFRLFTYLQPGSATIVSRSWLQKLPTLSLIPGLTAKP